MMCFTTDGTEGYKVHEIMDIGKPAQLRFQIQLRKRAKDGTLYQLRFLNERGSDIAVVQICDGGAEAAQSITGSSFNGKKHTSVDDDDQWLYLQGKYNLMTSRAEFSHLTSRQMTSGGWYTTRRCIHGNGWLTRVTLASW